MRLISLPVLRAFYEDPNYADSKAPILSWHGHVLKADWADPSAVKESFGNASILKDNRVVFNIAGNKYRIVTGINYPYRIVYVKFIGTHKQYDAIDAQTVEVTL